MRIWSLDPSYLDSKGLVACWRETLLAQKALAGLTKGYTAHPQLIRFRAASHPESAIATYLHLLADEADARGYNFDRSLVRVPADASIALPVTEGQLRYEFGWLLSKLDSRDPERAARLRDVHGEHTLPMEAAIFHVIPGDIEPWEVVPWEVVPWEVLPNGSDQTD
ncbi:pyrimidine dimer DNA glycosylase/endonuclease V [Lysinibacter cavernae]|uniref:DNA lyase n=1 Tax=Lysinibacter cavernae TaxID=1640652 RepID=A0A7X5TT36_9MICO|nr:pyrimidine dimer DNA glycosylase/endonuclease V [Lysinibacter cavernae]NIH52297.1 hypothetical protein [Lysinibacter cavernae]